MYMLKLIRKHYIPLAADDAESLVTEADIFAYRSNKSSFS